jgi:hypothetical protein
MVRCRAMRNRGCIWILGWLFCVSSHASWWPWSSAGPTLHETPLTKPELAQLKYEAGWLPSAPDELLIDVGNRLPGPLVCRALSVQRKDDTLAQVPLQPPVYIPVGASRRLSAPGVTKAQLKQWSVTCACFKRQGGKQCESMPS